MLSGFGAQRIKEQYPNCNITLRNVGDLFAGAYEIRGITNVTYYRLLIPTLIPEYDKIIYSDVDVIFRDDLSHVYQSTLFEDEYVAVGLIEKSRRPCYLPNWAITGKFWSA